MLRSAELCRVVGQGILRLCNADRNSVKTEALDLLYCLVGLCGVVNAVCAVDLLCDDVKLFLDGQLLIVEGLVFAPGALDGLNDCVRKLDSTVAALEEHI